MMWRPVVLSSQLASPILSNFASRTAIHILEKWTEQGYFCCGQSEFGDKDCGELECLGCCADYMFVGDADHSVVVLNTADLHFDSSWARQLSCHHQLFHSLLLCQELRDYINILGMDPCAHADSEDLAEAIEFLVQVRILRYSNWCRRRTFRLCLQDSATAGGFLLRISSAEAVSCRSLAAALISEDELEKELVADTACRLFELRIPREGIFVPEFLDKVMLRADGRDPVDLLCLRLVQAEPSIRADLQCS